MIPVIDIAPLFHGPSTERDQADAAFLEAARTVGFATVAGLPPDVPVRRGARQEILRIFALDDAAKRRLWRQKFDPGRPNVYRGWFPLQAGHATYKEGIDLGPDVAYGERVVDPADPLREATPLPPESALPGWRASVRDAYAALERTAAVLMRSLARSLGLAEGTFDEAFAGGISTFRLIRYPVRDAASLGDADHDDVWVTHRGERRYVSGRPHVDSGFLTLVAQDGVDGLQARTFDGSWLDVPPLDGTLAVNLGSTLERWTGGRLRATEHRVIGSGCERCSLPFFHEPRVDAVIAPLPLPDAVSFAPFLYGDHLWATATGFVEFAGLEALRPSRGRCSSVPAA